MFQTISTIYVDTIYKDVVSALPNVDDSAASQVALPVGFNLLSLNYRLRDLKELFHQ
jgi:predicted TIM-barrel enzyme